MQFDNKYVFQTCYITMTIRKYTNFKIIFDDINIGNELYNSSNSWYIYPINLYRLDKKPILVNSKKRIKLNLQREALLNKRKNEKEKKQIKMKMKENDNTFIKINPYNYKAINSDCSAQLLLNYFRKVNIK